MVGKRTATLQGNFIVVATRQQVSSDLAGEVVILDLKNGIYFGLDEVGARIWSLIQEPQRIDQIRDVLLEEYEVEADECIQDLLTLLAELAEAELIEVRSDETDC